MKSAGQHGTGEWRKRNEDRKKSVNHQRDLLSRNPLAASLLLSACVVRARSSDSMFKLDLLTEHIIILYAPQAGSIYAIIDHVRTVFILLYRMLI